jgi:hypothetical protein
MKMGFIDECSVLVSGKVSTDEERDYSASSRSKRSFAIKIAELIPPRRSAKSSRLVLSPSVRSSRRPKVGTPRPSAAFAASVRAPIWDVGSGGETISGDANECVVTKGCSYKKGWPNWKINNGIAPKDEVGGQRTASGR